jgi:hypothetical protein
MKKIFVQTDSLDVFNLCQELLRRFDYEACALSLTEYNESVAAKIPVLVVGVFEEMDFPDLLKKFGEFSKAFPGQPIFWAANCDLSFVEICKLGLRRVFVLNRLDMSDVIQNVVTILPY